MSILRSSSVRHVEPDPNDMPKRAFRSSSLKDVVRTISDGKGNVVSESSVRVPIREEIPHSVFANDGITCEMFSVENMQRAGVALAPVERSFYGMSLDRRSQVVEELNEADFDQALEPDVESSKIE